MSDNRPLILGIGGTPRPNSSTELALRASLLAAEKAGARTIMLGGPELILPIYDPNNPVRTVEAKRLVDHVRACDGIVIASPCYHGSVSGLMKNALDYLEDLRGDDYPYLDGLAAGCISCGAGWQAVGSTLGALRGVVHALRGWPTPIGAGINTTGKIFDADGNCMDESAKSQLEKVGSQVVQFARAFETPRARLVERALRQSACA